VPGNSGATGDLSALGVDSAAERLYRQVLRTAPADLPAHLAALGWTAEQGQAAYRTLVTAGLVVEGTSGALVPEPPQDAIGRLIEQEAARLETRRRELVNARSMMETFVRDQRRHPGHRAEASTLEVVPRPDVVGALEHATRTTSGLIRHFILSTATVPARDEPLVRWVQSQVAQGRPLRTIYPASFLQSGNVHGAMWVRDWADVGEEQRLVEQVPHAYTVFGEELALACTEWGVVTDDLVAIRSPLLVRALIAIFDEAWRVGLPVPHSSYEAASGDRLLPLLAAGLKDEAIARYLGISLRTVRRRVAELMAELGAQTRFQLGSAAERRGLLSTDRS
jgi:DNA-binding CsgD family transcriptional regulator